MRRICPGSMGRKGRKSDAPAMLNMLPKLELVPIMMYFMMLPKVRRPSTDPFGNNIQVTLQHDHVGRILCHVDGGVNGKADICGMERRRIVYAVAKIADHSSAPFEREDDPVFLGRRNPAEQVHNLNLRHQRLIVHLLDFRRP